MPFTYKIIDYSADVIAETAKKKPVALEAVGIQAESDIKDEITDLGAVDTGRLRSSMAHVVDKDSVYIGTDVEYGIYVHEGTGKYTTGGTPKERWVYRDPLTGEFRMGFPQKPRRFIRNAMERFAKDYIELIKEYLKK